MKYNMAASDSSIADHAAGLVMFETPAETAAREPREHDQIALGLRTSTSLQVFPTPVGLTILATGNAATRLRSAVLAALESVLGRTDFEFDFEVYAAWGNAVLSDEQRPAFAEELLARGYAAVEIVDEKPVREGEYPFSAYTNPWNERDVVVRLKEDNINRKKKTKMQISTDATTIDFRETPVVLFSGGRHESSSAAARICLQNDELGFVVLDPDDAGELTEALEQASKIEGPVLVMIQDLPETGIDLSEFLSERPENVGILVYGEFEPEDRTPYDAVIEWEILTQADGDDNGRMAGTHIKG